MRLAVVEELAAIGTSRRLPGWRAAHELCLRARQDPDARVARAAESTLARLEDRLPPPAAAPRARDVPLATDSLPPVDLGTVTVRLVTAGGTALLELDGDRFPRTVANFLRLVDSGFYDRGTFHRVVPAFVVQGGCPRGDGWGDAGWSIPCEYGDLRYDEALRMADKTQTYRIVVREIARQNGVYATFMPKPVFGRLERLDVSPARPCSDAAFLRRACLDTIGTLPRQRRRVPSSRTGPRANARR